MKFSQSPMKEFLPEKDLFADSEWGTTLRADHSRTRGVRSYTLRDRLSLAALCERVKEHGAMPLHFDLSPLAVCSGLNESATQDGTIPDNPILTQVPKDKPMQMPA